MTLANDSAEKYRRATAHSPFCSASTLPTSRMTARSFGKIPITSVRRFTSLLRRSIAWSQYTFSPSRAAERDHVTDLDVCTGNNDAVDQQLDERTPLGEASVFQAFSNRCTEVFDPRGQGL